MWKVIFLKLLPCFYLFTQTSLGITAHEKHLQQIREKYPYGLIGDDYGILTEEDLAINTCHAIPAPFTQKSLGYSYWRCFPTSMAKMICEEGEYDTEEEAETAFMELKVSTPAIDYIYSLNKVIPHDLCQDLQKSWEKLTLNEKYFCISGSLPMPSKSESGTPEEHNKYDKFKTKKGCDSYFFGGCSLKYQIKHGFKPRPSTLPTEPVRTTI